jgi:hypothetical protein
MDSIQHQGQRIRAIVTGKSTAVQPDHPAPGLAPLPAEPTPPDLCDLLGMRKRYGVIQYRGSIQQKADFGLVLESNDPVEAMCSLLDLYAQARAGFSYTIAINEQASE